MDKNKVLQTLIANYSDTVGSLYGKKNSVRFLKMETLSTSHRVFRWKTIDATNYAHRVALTFTGDGRELVSMSCTCGCTQGCVHVTAAILQGLEDDLISYEPGDQHLPTVEPSHPLTNEITNPTQSPPTFRGELHKIPTESSHPWIKTIVAESASTEATLTEPPATEAPDILPEPPYQWDGEVRKMEIFLGKDLATGEDVCWYPNDTEQVFHTNTGIIGTMGTGKTQFTKSLVTQLYREQLAHKNYDGQPYHILIFDYKGDYNESKPEFVEAVQAQIYKPYRLPYNPFSLIKGQSFRPLLPVHTANVFKDTLTKSFRLGPKQQQLLLDCILDAYYSCGILTEAPSTWDRKPPTFEQVYQIFLEKTDYKAGDSLAAAMQKLHQFHIFASEPGTGVSIGEFIQGVTVLDLSGYDEDIQSFVVAITLDQFYAHMMKIGSGKTDGRYRQLHTLILVDEADHFMKEDYPSLRKLMKEGREFGVGMVLSTQSLNHFIGGEEDYSRYILTWVVHNVSDLSRREVEYIYKLQPKSPEIDELYGGIKSLSKHESILKIANSAHTKIRDKAFFELEFS